METKTKIVSGLIMVIFALFGTAYFTPEYVERDLCADKNIWENVTEIVFYNETFPSIARYYCNTETDISKQDCFNQDRLINTDGCKWAGRLSGTKRSAYIINDPPLVVDGKKKPTDTINKTKLDNKYCKKGGTNEIGGISSTGAMIGTRKSSCINIKIDESIISYPIEVSK